MNAFNACRKDTRMRGADDAGIADPDEIVIVSVFKAPRELEACLTRGQGAAKRPEEGEASTFRDRLP